MSIIIVAPRSDQTRYAAGGQEPDVPRLTNEHRERNRRNIVRAASQRFLAKGTDHVGIDEVMKAAGLTHGGFYNHFPSKEALMVEACQHAFAEELDANSEIMDSKAGRPSVALTKLVDRYLSADQRDNLDDAGPASTLAADVARQGANLQEVFSEGIETNLAGLTEVLLRAAAQTNTKLTPKLAREQAIALLSELVGAMVLSRAVQKARPLLAEEMLQANKQHIRRASLG